MSLVVDEVTGTYEEINQWTYENGENATQLQNFVRRFTSNEWLMRELGFLYRLRGFNILSTMAGQA